MSDGRVTLIEGVPGAGGAQAAADAGAEQLPPGFSAVTDSLGRRIVIRKLNAIQRVKVLKVLGAAAQVQQYVGLAFSVAHVVEVAGQRMPPVNSEQAVDNMIALLDDAGLEAISNEKTGIPSLYPQADEALELDLGKN